MGRHGCNDEVSKNLMTLTSNTCITLSRDMIVIIVFVSGRDNCEQTLYMEVTDIGVPCNIRTPINH